MKTVYKQDYTSLTSEIILTEQQKTIINNGIKLQQEMWNFLVEVVNYCVDYEDLVIDESSAVLEDLLWEHFLIQIYESGLSGRMVRGVVNNYINAWKRFYNPETKNQRKPKKHTENFYHYSLFFIDVDNQLNENNQIKIPLWNRKSERLKKYSNPVKSKDVWVQVLDGSDGFYSKGSDFKTKQIIFYTKHNKYFIKITFEFQFIPFNNGEKQIGLDWGLMDNFIDSNGNVYNPPKRAERILQRISQLQKILSKKEKGSKNYCKLQAKINKAWIKFNNIKKNWIEHFSLFLCRNHSLIVFESLDIVGMKNKAHKSRRRQMMLYSFYDVKERVKQKSKRFNNCTVIQIDQYFPSSQLCSTCGKNTGKKDVSIRDFICPYCGTHHNRDINAAINILKEGQRLVLKKH